VSRKTSVFGIDGKEYESVELPRIFETPFRPDVIHKAYVNLLSHSFQVQGRYPLAGEVVSAESRNTGLGIARIARAKGEGFVRAGQAAGVAGVRHGRVAHPPESKKRIYKKINKKEKKLALCSAIAATTRRDLVERRGHDVGKISNFPVIVSNEIESISGTKSLYRILESLGIGPDLLRANLLRNKGSRRTKRRGTHGRSGISALLVVGKDNKIQVLSKSIPGVNIKSVQNLSVLDFVPGSKPIRLTIFSENALIELKNTQVPINIIEGMISSN
jgi:large subunit ribosomal protein L4e